MAKTADFVFDFDFVEKGSAFILSLKLIYNVNKLGKWLSGSCDQSVIWKLLLRANWLISSRSISKKFRVCFRLQC